MFILDYDFHDHKSRFLINNRLAKIYLHNFLDDIINSIKAPNIRINDVSTYYVSTSIFILNVVVGKSNMNDLLEFQCIIFTM